MKIPLAEIHAQPPDTTLKAVLQRQAWWRALKIGCCALLGLVAWLALLDLSKTPLEPRLEPSWVAAITEAAANGWQFGREIIYTYGPLGHLAHSTFAERLFTPNLIGRALLSAGFLLLIGGLSHRLSLARRAIFLITAVLIAALSYQAMCLFAIACTGHLISVSSRERTWCTSLAVIGLVFSAAAALIKLTFFFYAVVALSAAAIAGGMARRNWKWTAGCLGLFAVTVAAFWIMAGQRLTGFPLFLRTALEVTSGYASTMNLPAPPHVLWSGIAVAVLVLFQLAALTWTTNEPRHHAFILFILVLALFVSWKLGFTRADSHTNEFFAFAIMIALGAQRFFPAARGAAVHAAENLCVLVVLALSLICIAHQDPGIAKKLAANLRTRVIGNPAVVLHPEEERRRQRTANAEMRKAYALPQTIQAVERRSITVFGHEQAIAVANGLNFVPTPTVQSYCAYTPKLAQIDSAFYAHARAPEFALFKLQTIDNRLPTLNNARALLQLAFGYEAILAERGYLLLRRRDSRPAVNPTDSPVTRQGQIALGRFLPVPAEPTWLELQVRPKLRGRLLSMLYQPPIVELDIVTADGQTVRRRILPTLAGDGFLINPLLLSEADFAAFANGETDGVTVKQVRVVNFYGIRPFVHRQVNYRLRPMSRPPRGGSVAADAVRQLTQYDDVLTTPAASVGSSNPVERFLLDGRNFLLVHAPGELRFSIPSGAKRVNGLFAIRADAYHATSGVVFEASCAAPDGGNITLYRRLLSPREQPADRGVQRFAAELPKEAAGELILRTLPGPSGKSEWAWSGWSHIRFE